MLLAKAHFSIWFFYLRKLDEFNGTKLIMAALMSTKHAREWHGDSKITMELRGCFHGFPSLLLHFVENESRVRDETAAWFDRIVIFL